MKRDLSANLYEANAVYPVKMQSEDGQSKDESVEWVSGMVSADVKEWRTMYGRMGKKPGTLGT